MSWRGRIICTVLSMMVFRHLIGAVIGFFVGYQIDKLLYRLRQGIGADSGQATLVRSQFLPFLFTSLGYLAKADGRVSEAEISHVEALMQHYGFDAQARQQAIVWFKEGTGQEALFQSRLSAFAGIVRDKPAVKKVMLELLISLAMADGTIDAREEAILLKIAVALGVRERMFLLLLKQLKGQQDFARNEPRDHLADAYKVLGVNPEDDISVIKKAYRKLISEHHPDKLIAQGVPEEAIRIATEKSQLIQAAYDLIKKQRSQAGGH